MGEAGARRRGGASRYGVRLAALLLAGLAWRAAYVWAQPVVDPTFARPVLDGAYYLRWAESLVSGGGGPEGAYYLAPLYGWVLSGWLALAGHAFAGLYLAQHALTLVSAALAAGIARRAAGDVAGLATAALVLFHHPLLFFASVPVGETLAIALLVAALCCATRSGPLPALGAGALVGLASLARPNLLLVPLVWAGLAAWGGRWRRAVLLLVALALVLLPVTLRNRAASGHWVPVSSNAGITAYHGNAPGARGTYTAVPGVTGEVLTQREEATRRAQELAGRPLDPVEADRFWGRRALAARLESPWATLGLLARRAALTLGPLEEGLDAHPMADADPFRLTWGVGRAWRPEGATWREVPLLPFGLIAALAAASLAGLGVRQSGGGATWGAVAAACATPLLFYVASRYRLPLAALLSIPAGCGLALLVRRAEPRGERSGRAAAWLVAAVVLSLSLATGLARRGELRVPLGEALAKRAAQWRSWHPERADALARAAAAGEAAVRLAPCSSCAQFALGATFERERRAAEAAEAYRRALATRCPHEDPEGFSSCRATSASNLAALEITAGRAASAIALLRQVIAHYPVLETARVNLIAALLATGEVDEARVEVERARREGIALEPDLVRAVEEALGGSGSAGGGGRAHDAR